VTPSNIFAATHGDLGEELVERLAGSGSVRIERIVSRGHTSPEGFWYDQPAHEFVILISGAARLSFEGDAAPVSLAPGDWIQIPAGARHRVEWTAPGLETIWLAVHFEDAGGGAR